MCVDELNEDCWREILTHTSSPKDLTNLRSVCRRSYVSMPYRLVLVAKDGMIEAKEITIETDDSIFAEQHVSVRVNGEEVVDLFFAARQQSLHLNSLCLLH